MTKEQALEALDECMRGGGGYGTVVEFIEQSQPVLEWQPIGTAPKDKDVLVFCESSGEQMVAFHKEADLWQFAATPERDVVCKPDYWMPLPAAPRPERG